MIQKEKTITTRVVSAVSQTSGDDPQELPSLQQAIETDALDAIYAHESADGDGRDPPTVLFSYAGYEICVHSATDIEVR